MEHGLDCSKCGARMERGQLVDHGHGAIYPAAWTGGEPRWSRWLGLKINRKDLLRVATYRCPRCGFLESYAEEGGWPE